MEVRIYDRDMMFKGLIENQTSLIWTRKYYEPGTFELHCPVTEDNRSLIRLGRLVWVKGAAEAGVIEYISMQETDIKNEITVKGRFLESYLDRRLIRPRYTCNNANVEDTMQALIQNAEEIPLLKMGNLHGYTEKVSFQATYKNLLQYIQRLSKYSTIGFRFRPDFTNKTLTFETYKGLDRSEHQHDRNQVIFSPSYGNLYQARYTTDDQNLKNVCYVGGQGEGLERTFVTVGDDKLTGLDRREVFLSASDITKDENTTEAQYKAQLEQRGNDLLEADVMTEAMECTTIANGNFIYKENYDLGDIVTVKKDNWGVSNDLRITELQEVYEYGAMKVTPTLGTPLPETIDWAETNY